MAAGFFGKVQRSAGVWGNIKKFGKGVWKGIKKVGATILNGIGAVAGAIAGH